MPILTLVLALAATLAGSGAARAQSNDKMTQVDNVLDRLEKRLLDQEADGMTFGEKGPDAALPVDETPPGKAKKTTKYKFGKQKIQSSTTEHDRVKALANTIADLENQVDQLASNVQKTKQTILDDAKIDNYVAIEALLQETDTAAIRTLNIKLDGYPVYELHDAAGLWLPSKGVPLYAGPLQPGAHRIDLEARIVLRHKQSLPANSDVYRFVNKTFDLQIPGGTQNARYVITITPPDKLDGQADATMKEAN